jgi:hypothetical protein
MKTTRLLICLIALFVVTRESWATDYTGIWKDKCSNYYGIQIKYIEKELYSVSFCGLDGCFKPGEWTPNSRIEGDPEYKIISPTELGIKKCTDDPTWIVAEKETTESHFAPGVIDRKPIGAEKNKGNHIKSKKKCLNKGGTWFEEKGYYAYCVLPYADAGKPCKNSKDCIGHCIMPLDKKMLDGTPLKEGYGICQLNDSTDDCGKPHFENGEIIYFNYD